VLEDRRCGAVRDVGEVGVRGRTIIDRVALPRAVA
jgi:hypothetical protein